MTFFKRIFFTIGLVALSLPEAVSSPYTISDDRVRSLDITPVLGRGYSIMTNMFHSTCLSVEDVTQPSYNYDYQLSNFFTGTDRESELEGAMSASLGIGPIKAAVSGSFSSSSKQSGESQIIVASMKLERYYSSVREEASPLAVDAFTLLDRQDYVGFFKACGPNYVRGIRRAQEVVAIFKFFSSSVEKAKSFAMALSVSAVVASASGSGASKSKFKSITNSLEIEIHGYGMGLNQNSAETLVATSLEEYNEVLKYAFRSFTQSEDSYQIGMVYGIEVVPWVNNVSFQVASKLLEENVEIPVTRSLIQKSYHMSNNRKNTTWVHANRGDYNCKNSFYVIDKYGYCCEIDSIYDYTLKVYDNQNTDNSTILNARICRPIRALDKALVKDNLSANGEFVARLDSALRFRLNQISTLERCISATRAQPTRYLYNVLKSQDTVKYDKTIPVKFTLAQLKATVDPLNDYGMVEHMGKELDEWIEMYYSPCLAALFGSNIESSPSVDPQYFMAYPWHRHPECMRLSCMSTNQRWNRAEGGGCVPSLINGASSAKYNATDDTDCSKSTEDEDEVEEKCKYDTTELIEYETKVHSCWGNTISGSLYYMMEQFCMPQLTSEIIEGADRQTIKTAIDTGCEIDLPAL